jgi:hypothetical protein
MVSTEYIRQQIGHFRDGIAAYGLGDLYEDELAVFEECLAYREGYDPAERLPEAGVKVLVQSERTGTLESASIQIWAETGEQKWQGRGWWAPIGYARRWYPMPGGER